MSRNKFTTVHSADLTWQVISSIICSRCLLFPLACKPDSNVHRLCRCMVSHLCHSLAKQKHSQWREDLLLLATNHWEMPLPWVSLRVFAMSPLWIVTTRLSNHLSSIPRRVPSPFQLDTQWGCAICGKIRFKEFTSLSLQMSSECKVWLTFSCTCSVNGHTLHWLCPLAN